MLRNKYRAAILVGKDGGFKGPDRLCTIDDFLLVESDERTEHRHGNGVVRHRERFDGLACDLTDGFAGDERLGAVCDCDAFRDLHHQSAHQHGRLRGRALVVDCKLDLREGNEVQTYRAGIPGNDAGKLDNLVACALACIRIAVKMHRADRDTAFCDHMTGDRAVNAAGDEQHGLTVRADRHTARTGDLAHIDERAFLAYLNADMDLRLADINAQSGEPRQQRMPEFLADVLGTHGELLVRTPGEHLEGVGRVRIIRERFPHEPGRGFLDRTPVLFRCIRRADGMNAEHARKTICRLQQLVLRDAVDKDAPLLVDDFDRGRRKRTANGVHERALKEGTVEPLQMDLGIAN